MSGLVQPGQKKAPVAPRASDAVIAAVLAKVAALPGPATTLPQRYRAAHGAALDARSLGFAKLGALLAVGERRGLFALERTARRADGASGGWCVRGVGEEVTEAAETEAGGLLGFYHYARPSWSAGARDATAAWLRALCDEHALGGRVRVACEGVNAAVSGHTSELDAFQATLATVDGWDGVLFKHEACTPAQRWPGLSCWTADELCGFGADAAARAALDAVGPGRALAPRAFAAKATGNAVLVDVRNAYETAVGSFEGALDPKTRTFADFQSWLARPATRAALDDKDVLMYCTGGVRCERATAALRASLPSEERDRVFHLEGGIVAYLDQVPEQRLFRGANYVFDRRNRHGCAPRGSAEVLGRCLTCRAPWDTYRGSATCATCKVRVLLCDACLSSRDDAVLVCELCS